MRALLLTPLLLLLAAPRVTADIDVLKIVDLIGNTMFWLDLTEKGLIKNDGNGKVIEPKFLADAVLNGMYCESKNPNLNAELIQASTGHAPPLTAEEQTANENLYTKYKFTPDVIKEICDQQDLPADAKTCFCSTPKHMFHACVGLLTGKIVKLANQDSKCPKDALADLKLKGYGALGAGYDPQTYKKGRYAKDMLDKVFGQDAAVIEALIALELAAEYFCDAINPDVEKALQVLYKADAQYYILEQIMLIIVFGPEATITNIKCTPELEANPFGKCVCEFKTGLSFCFNKVLGHFFNEAGFLNCPTGSGRKKRATASFNNDKKPTTLPYLAHVGGKDKTAASAGTSPAAFLAALATVAALWRA